MRPRCAAAAAAARACGLLPGRWATKAAWPAGQYHGQDAFLGDPPHESQGWYSVFDADRSTLAVVASAVRRPARRCVIIIIVPK